MAMSLSESIVGTEVRLAMMLRFATGGGTRTQKEILVSLLLDFTGWLEEC